MRRMLLTLAALTIPITGVAVVGMSGEAGAAAAKITCTTISGNIAGDITVSGCTGGVTGGSSEPLPALTLASGGTITWTSGSTTTIGAPTLSSTSAKKCPGYSKVKGATEPTAEKFTATVTADTGDGLKIPGVGTGEVCLGTDGSVTALKSLKTT